MARITTPPDPNAAVAKPAAAAKKGDSADAFIRAGAEKELAAPTSRPRMKSKPRSHRTFRILDELTEALYAEAERVDIRPAELVEDALRLLIYGVQPTKYPLPLVKRED